MTAGKAGQKPSRRGLKGRSPANQQPSTGRRLQRGRDLFFVENNLVYSRCLRLSRDGTYQQIDRDRTAATEMDRGTWEQDADDTVGLHAERRGLRFRAVLSGPLEVVLDTPEAIAALPEVAAAIRRLLAASQDTVFAAATAREMSVPPAAVTVDRAAESFGRNDLLELAAQIDDVYQTEQSHTYRLTPVRPPGGPLLLVLHGATFGPDQVARVCRDFHVPHGAAPPFYFAQTDAQGFAKQVGSYRALPEPGGPTGDGPAGTDGAAGGSARRDFRARAGTARVVVPRRFLTDGILRRQGLPKRRNAQRAGRRSAYPATV